MRLIDADKMAKRLEEWNTADPMDKALYNFAMSRINEQPTVQPEPHWIPVAERLPEIKEHHISEACIVYCKHSEHSYTVGFAELEENIFGQVGWNCERDNEYHEALGTVLAWMPLPEPYRAERRVDE